MLGKAKVLGTGLVTVLVVWWLWWTLQFGLNGCSGCFSRLHASDWEPVLSFAVEHIGQGSLVGVVFAEKQVVAGLLYHLVLLIKHVEDSEVHLHEVYVVQPLMQSLELHERTDLGPVVFYWHDWLGLMS